MSRQVRISIDDDEVFERLKRRKDALDLSWEDALRRGLRDSAEPPRGPKTTEPQSTSSGGRGSPRGNESGAGQPAENPSPFDADFGEQIAQRVLASVSESVSGAVGHGGGNEAGGAGRGGAGSTGTTSSAGTPLDEEIDRLEDAEDAVLVLGDSDGERVPLRVTLHTGPEGLDVEVVAVRSGKGTEEMNRFLDGARAEVAKRFARGETATLEMAAGETYDVRGELSWAPGPDGAPTVTDVTVRDVVFED
jgi:hypothetical protein